MSRARLRIYHNPRCSKSRDLLQYLQASGLSFESRLYMEQPLSQAELDALLASLGMQARELIRREESLYRELGLADPQLSETVLRQAMLEHPRLIQRPILAYGDRAVLGRPQAAAEAWLAGLPTAG